MINYSPHKIFIREGKRLARQNQSFSVEFVTEKYRRCFEKLQNSLFGTEQAGYRTILAFWLMLPFITVHFYAMAGGANGWFSEGVAHYEFR